MRRVLVSAMVVLACNEQSPTGGEAKAVVATPEALPTRILVDLPAGIEVALNGRARGVTPLPAFDIEPGAYTVTLVAGCKTVDVQLEAAAHETATVDQSRAAGLGLVTLEITARNLAGEAIEHVVALDDEVLGGGNGSSTSLVPPCKARMKVTSEGLGGFIEDVDFDKEEKVVREVVLAPGPDMVRIHGGPFTLGPPASSSRTKARWDLRFPRKDVVFATFDMDRTEVTATQFHQCRVSGRCAWDVGLVGWPKFPRGSEKRLCTTVVDYGDRKPVPGREGHPMNCVSHHEAEMYCAANGKRLPTAAEWEFASRSRKSEYYCPWAPPEDVSAESPICKGSRAARVGTHAVCRYPDHVTEQGLCDMPWNVTEIVVDEHVREPEMPEGAVTTRGGWNEFHDDDWLTTFRSQPPPHGRYLEPNDQDILMGFRCVRDVNPRAADEIKE